MPVVYDPDRILLQSMMQQQRQRRPSRNEMSVRLGQAALANQEPTTGWGSALSNVAKSIAGAYAVEKGQTGLEAEQKVQDEQIQEQYNQMRADALAGGGSSGLTVGTLNPGDVTPESWAEYQTGGDSKVLRLRSPAVPGGSQAQSGQPSKPPPLSRDYTYPTKIDESGNVVPDYSHAVVVPGSAADVAQRARQAQQEQKTQQATALPKGPQFTPVQKNALTAIDTEDATLKGVLDDLAPDDQGKSKYDETFGGVKSAKLALASQAGGYAKSATERFLYDKEGEIEIRAKLFNQVSSVLHERAGAAQSPSEKETILKFMPGDYDDINQIRAKLNAYRSFLANKRSGIVPAEPSAGEPSASAITTQTLPPPATPTAAPKQQAGGRAKISSQAEYDALPSGTPFIDPKGRPGIKP